MKNCIPALTWALLMSTSLPCEVDAEWPQFRGLNSSGHGSGKALPVEFGPGVNELWHVDLESGHSSPCISGDSLFLTAWNAKKKELAVLRVDLREGKVIWRRAVPVKHVEKGHPSFNPASSSPACDGDRVVAYFGSFGLICFDLEGAKLWEIPMPLTKSYAGNATSPMIVGDKVILYRGNHVDHFLLAVDKHTGKEVWKVKQEEPFHSELACTACPIVADNKLIVHSARAIQAVDIETGQRLWIANAATTATSTPVIAGKEVIVAAWNKMGEPALRPDFPSFAKLLQQHDKNKNGTISRDELPRLMIFHRPDGAEAPQNGASIQFRFADKDRSKEITESEWTRTLKELEGFRARYSKHGMLAIPLASKGQVDLSKIRTLERQGIPEVPSPLVHAGLLYFVKNGGVLTCLDIASAKRVYRIRTKGRGTHYASPILGDGKLYSTAGEGKISVIQLGRMPKILAVNDMRDLTYATPAISDGVLYVRTHSRLYAFGLR